MEEINQSDSRKRHRTMSADKENKKSNLAAEMTDDKPLGDKDLAKIEETKETEVAGNSGLDEKLEKITSSLAGIHTKLDELTKDQVKTDIELSSVKYKLDRVEHDTGDFATDIDIIKRENQELKSDMAVLKGMVIKQNEQINVLKSECTDLKTRYMKHNVLFHNLPESPKSPNPEDCAEIIRQQLLRAGYTDNTRMERAHRLGKFDPKSTRPRPIVARFATQTQAESLIKFGKTIKDKGPDKGQFKITPQYPPEVQESRRKMGEWIDVYKKKSDIDDPKIQMTNDKLLINGQVQKDPLPPPSARDLLQMSYQDKCDIRKKCPELHCGTSVKERGSSFTAIVAEVQNVKEANTVYRSAILEYPRLQCATHNIACCRIKQNPHSPSDLLEAWQDDGEHGAGRHLRYLLQRRNLTNIMVIVSRIYGGVHLGSRRFQAMETALNNAIDSMDEHNPGLKMSQNR